MGESWRIDEITLKARIGLSLLIGCGVLFLMAVAAVLHADVNIERIIQDLAVPGGELAKLIYGRVSEPYDNDGWFLVAFALDGLIYAAVAWAIMELIVLFRKSSNSSRA